MQMYLFLSSNHPLMSAPGNGMFNNKNNNNNHDNNSKDNKQSHHTIMEITHTYLNQNISSTNNLQQVKINSMLCKRCNCFSFLSTNWPPISAPGNGISNLKI